MSGFLNISKADPCKIKDKIPDANPVKIYCVTFGLIKIGNKLSDFASFVDNNRSICQPVVQFNEETKNNANVIFYDPVKLACGVQLL